MEQEHKKLTLGGWLLTVLAFNYLYQLYVDGLNHSSLSSDKAFLITAVDGVLGIALIVLLLSWVISIIKRKKLNLFKIPKKYLLAVGGILIILVGFYWFSYRPKEIKKDCNSFAISEAIENTPLTTMDFLKLPVLSPTSAQNTDGSLNVINKEEVKTYRKENYMYSQILYNRSYTECIRTHGI